MQKSLVRLYIEPASIDNSDKGNFHSVFMYFQYFRLAIHNFQDANEALYFCFCFLHKIEPIFEQLERNADLDCVKLKISEYIKTFKDCKFFIEPRR
jgi:hypothetical protein